MKKLLVAGLAASAVLLAACGSDDGSAADAKAGESSASAEKAPGGDTGASKPDLAGIPDVVAEVNGKEIGKDEFVPAYERQFQQFAARAQMTGQQPDEKKLKKQVADTLVNTELLEQAADERGIKATDQQVDKTLTELAKSNQMGSAKEFLAALKKQGMSEDEVMEQVAMQVKLDQLLVEESGGVEASEAELRKAYDAMKAQAKQAGQKAPSFKKVRPQVEEQVRTEKLNSTAQVLLKDLRKDADITVHV